jgi:RNA polymerase sigma-32 factor
MARTSEAEHGGYLSLVRQAPRLSREHEHELAERWCRHGDTSARDLLVRAQLRIVVTIARRYRRHDSATMDELIAEGNFGLLQALTKFDPDRGTRFVTYAVYWIRAYVSEYLVRSRSLVTTGVRSKAHSKIRRARKEIGDVRDADEQIAQRLALSPERLRALSERLEVRDVPWDAVMADAPRGRCLEANESYSPNVEERLMSDESRKQMSDAVSYVVSKLDERERFVVKQRLMAHRDEELSLAEIARRFGVSRERVRQIEARAVRKIRAALARLPVGLDWPGCNQAA